MAEWIETALTVIIGLVIMAGVIGLIIPMFPGLLIAWLAALGYGLLTGFSSLGIFLFALITILAIGGSLVDNLLMALGGKKGGASWVTIVTALVFGVAGTILFPPFGGLVAAPLSILLLEYWRVRDCKLAWQAFLGMVTGLGLSVAARLLIGGLILVLWLVWVWLG